MIGQRYGFNVQWMYTTRSATPAPVDEKLLDAVVSWGFDFIRIPLDYRFWVPGLDVSRPDETVLAQLDGYVDACRSRGLHVSVNLHRAPGYVITGWESEPYNLWADEPAQTAFCGIWADFARRWSGIPGDELSFDLVNEPPALGLRGFTRDAHEQVIRAAVSAIREVDPARPIVIDGLDGGNLAMPELADLGVTHSTRGYQPMSVSHYEAGWWPGSVGLPVPEYPGDYDGRTWNRATLRDYYQPWVDLADQGVPVHVGEFGCHNSTPDDVALRWFADLLATFQELGWGYALWNFEGQFGVVDHGRPGARYEQLDGYRVDRRLLDLLMEHRAG